MRLVVSDKTIYLQAVHGRFLSTGQLKIGLALLNKVSDNVTNCNNIFNTTRRLQILFLFAHLSNKEVQLILVARSTFF